MTEQRWSEVWSRPSAVLLGVCVVAYAGMLLSGGSGELAAISGETLMRFGAGYAPLVREGQLHRLIAATFLHINPLHLLLNCAALVAVGPRAEAEYGPARFVVITLGSGLVASLASLAWHWSSPVISAGASGALCGLIASVAFALWRERKRSELGGMLVWLGATLVFGALIGADNAAHLGGMVAGSALGFALRPKRAPTAGSTRPAAVLGLVALVAFGGAAATRERAQTASMLLNLGVEQARAGNDAEAVLLYQRALLLEPNDPLAHFNLGLGLSRLERFEEAIASHERSLELDGSEETRQVLMHTHLNHGVALAKAERFDEAISAYRKALALDGGYALGHYNLGLALMRKGDRAAALAALRRAHELQPDERTRSALADELLDEGLTLADESRHEQSLERLQEAARVDPKSWRIQVAIGVALTELGRHDDAIVALERAVELGGGERAIDGLAAALEARRDHKSDGGDLSGALDDLERATLLRLKGAK